MSVPDDLRSVAQHIKTKLGNISSFSRLRTRELPYWFGRMLTELVLLVEGDEIIYVTGRHDGTTSEVVVVTQNRIVRSAASDISRVDATIVSEAWPRHRIASVAASADETILSAEPFPDWPGRLTIQLRLINGPTILLPIERASTDGSDDDDAVREILRSAVSAFSKGDREGK